MPVMLFCSDVSGKLTEYQTTDNTVSSQIISDFGELNHSVCCFFFCLDYNPMIKLFHLKSEQFIEKQLIHNYVDLLE